MNNTSNSRKIRCSIRDFDAFPLFRIASADSIATMSDLEGLVSGLITVRDADVVKGKSPKWRSHPGNIRLKELIDEHCDKYFSRTTKKRDKTEMASRILEILAREGRRFLRQSNENNFLAPQNNDVLWVEMKEVDARNKVASGFRGVRRREKRKSETNK